MQTFAGGESVDAPRTAESDDESTLTRPSRWDDILYRIALDLDLDSEYELFAGQADIEDVFAALPALDRWRGFITAHYGFDANAIAAPEGAASTTDCTASRRCDSQTPGTTSAVEIGLSPDNRQASLDEGI